jgi:hypothetical protein
MDDEGATMTGRAKIAMLPLIAIVAMAHVGSPNVFFDGDAGPYSVRVIVRPPMVVPGLADVVVRVPGTDVRAVTVRPVFLRVGAAGAPAGDLAEPVRGEPSTFTARLWLMRSGAYSVYVTVDGSRGSGTAVVPVMSVATGRLGVSPGLAAILVALGAVLLIGLVTIIRAGAGESLVPPGKAPSPAQRRRANLVTAVSIPALALVVFGGARWWKAVDRDYERTMFNPPALGSSIETLGDSAVLTVSTRDTTPGRTPLSAFIPDHGKMMHLFLVSASSSTMAHLHPALADSTTFRATLPPLPPGAYRAFADVTTEQGSTITLSGRVDLPTLPAGSSPDDLDDAWAIDRRAVTIGAGAADTIAPGIVMQWSGGAGPITAGRDTDLRFTVRDASGAIVTLQPYLGMAGHAVVTADDGSVFIHLHPMGSVSPAVQRLFALRDRGDTTATGRLRLDDSSLAATTMADMSMPGQLSFPYEFPKAGRYHIWVQLRHGGKLLTGAFTTEVR